MDDGRTTDDELFAPGLHVAPTPQPSPGTEALA
jgi:hypothetical protein